MFYVAMLVFAAPVAALVAVCVLAVCAVRALRRRSWPSVAAVATLSACAWVLVYAAGVGTGDLASPRSASDLCGPGAYASPPLLERALPLSHQCRPVGGPTRELVPGAVNPLLAATALAGAAATVLAMRVGRSKVTHPATAGPRVPEGTT